MRGKLVVNGVNLDVNETHPISVTYSQADVKDTSKRKRSFSKSFDLPGTQKNIQFFKEYVMLSWVRNDNIITDINFNPSTELEAVYYIDEGERFRGYIRLTNVKILKDVVSFEINLYSNVSNFFQQWDDLMLSELGWSEYNHPLNESHIRESWNNQIKVNGVWTSNFTGSLPNGFGYLYGVIDYGFSADQTTFVDNTLYPLFYLREIFLKSFEYLGYTVNSNFIDSQEFKEYLFGLGGGEIPSLPDALVNDLEIEADFDANFSHTKSALVVDIPTFGSSVQSVSNYKILNLKSSETSFAETINTDVLGQLSGGIVSVGATATYNISVGFTATINNNASTDATLNGVKIQMRLFLVKPNGKTQIGYKGINGVISSTIWNFNTNFELTLTTNDDYYFQFEISSSATITGNGTYGSLTTSFDLNNTFELHTTCTSSQVVTNSNVVLSTYIPKMKVVDFIKGVVTQFNLQISEPNEENEVLIEPFDDFYLDASNFDDYTRKQDLSKQIQITPLATIQPNSLNFKYKEDLDYYRNNYYESTGNHFGNYEHNNNLSYGSNEQIYSLPWTLTPLVELDNGLFIPRIIKEESGVIKPFKGSARIYRYGGMRAGGFKIEDNGGTPIIQTNYPVLSNLDDIDNPTEDLCFATPETVFYTTGSYTTDTQYKRFYSKMINELSSIDSKMLASYFRVNKNDVSGEWMRRVKLINGVAYRFNILKDYNLNRDDSYYMELIKILEVEKVGSINVPLSPSVSSGETAGDSAS